MIQRERPGKYFREDLKFYRMLWEVADNGYAAAGFERHLG